MSKDQIKSLETKLNNVLFSKEDLVINKLSPEEEEELKQLQREYHRYDEYGEPMSSENEDRFDVLKKKKYTKDHQDTVIERLDKHFPKQNVYTVEP